jgi:hypothetical protein
MKPRTTARQPRATARRTRATSSRPRTTTKSTTKSHDAFVTLEELLKMDPYDRLRCELLWPDFLDGEDRP